MDDREVCVVCDGILTGRARSYCSAVCRQRAKRARQRATRTNELVAGLQVEVQALRMQLQEARRTRMVVDVGVGVREAVNSGLQAQLVHTRKELQHLGATHQELQMEHNHAVVQLKELRGQLRLLSTWAMRTYDGVSEQWFTTPVGSVVMKYAIGDDHASTTR